ncbi:MAG TPA: GatB/YqeY domain-containing protein [Candidatus Omnitrophota bacterium]|nr:GatB/YqeY domain-containing protein [Candidatus Omnitrophota bacterium]
MSLEDKISQDYIQAMKARDTLRSSTLNFLRAEIKNAKIDDRRKSPVRGDQRVETIADADVITVIKKQVKQRQDSITQFRAGSREDLAVKEEQELRILQSYLPAAMPLESLKAVVDEVIKSSGAVSMKDMGKVMKEVLAKVAGQADSQAVSALVKERLSK